MESDDNLTDTVGDTSEDCDDVCLNKLWGFWIEGVAVPAIAVFGIIGTAGTDTKDVTFVAFREHFLCFCLQPQVC